VVPGRPGHAAVIADALRLSFGTLTVLPVAPPRTVDSRTGGSAMVLAPLVGLALAAAAGLLLWLLGWSEGAGLGLGNEHLYHPHLGSALLASALTVGLLALLTRGMHLDGLADTADGLGSGRPAVEALAIMRAGDVGPFGVVTLVLTLLLQVAALGQLIAEGRGMFALALALVVSRLVLPLVCSRGIPAARAEGLGHAVAGTVTRTQLALSALLTVLAVGAAEVVVLLLDTRAVTPVGVAVVAVSLGIGGLLCWWCVRRLGGVTGDVLGACVETTFTAVLVLLCLL
jgi:adenosylcobinamide-GDP ribazoletransferase